MGFRWRVGYTLFLKGSQSVAIVAAACVRALAIIGGDIGLKAIEKFAVDNRQTVIAELWKGLEQFNRGEYLRAVISKNEVFAEDLRECVH